MSRRSNTRTFRSRDDLLKKAGELGLSSAEIPEAYGGLEMDKVTAAVIADRIAKYAGFATTWGGHTGIGTLPIVYFGTEEQKKKYLPRLAQEKSLVPMRYRKPLPAPTRSTAALAPNSRKTVSITSSTARKCGSPMPVSPTFHCLRQS